MNRSRDEFLPRAALPKDQNGVGMLRDLFDQLVNKLHSRGDADQPSKTRPAAKLLAQQAGVLVQLDRMQQTIQLGAQLFDVKRLGNIVRCSEPRRLNRRFDRAVLGEHDDRYVRIALANLLDQFQASDLWDFQIRDHDVDGVLVQDIERLLVVFGGVNVKPRFKCHIVAEVPRGDFIVYNQEI